MLQSSDEEFVFEGTQQADTTHVQPEDLSVDFTDLLEVNILETSVDNESKYIQTECLSRQSVRLAIFVDHHHALFSTKRDPR